MERGVKALVWVLLLATLLGAAVIALHPDYRAAARALIRGQVESSPIWQSNAAYYREVTRDRMEAHEAAK
jgi:hypothetical protein